MGLRQARDGDRVVGIQFLERQVVADILQRASTCAISEEGDGRDTKSLADPRCPAGEGIEDDADGEGRTTGSRSHGKELREALGHEAIAEAHDLRVRGVGGRRRDG